MTTNYLLADAIISPLGFNTEENLENLRKERSGLKLHQNERFFKEGFYAGILSHEILNRAFLDLGKPENFSKLEKMMILAVHKVIANNPAVNLKSTGLVISTTKGNIDLIENSTFEKDRIYLWKLAKVVADFFGFSKTPIIVSNACISGALAIKTANELIRAERFENAIVVGGDLVSDFVVSGFQSFQAISTKPCRPYSNDRNGISLGEAAAAVLIGPSKTAETKVAYIDAVTTNDANHISGPSRTGEGLHRCIEELLGRNSIIREKIDHLSAHGTATIYNDEMEAIAFNRSQLNQVPMHSLKGYYGHTLGASALIESIVSKHSLLNNELFSSLNFTSLGVTKPLHIIKEHQKKDLKLTLKTASGFGGCNIAMLLKKESL